MDENEKRAWEIADGKTDQILARFKTVIGVNTVVPPGLNYDTLVDLLEPEFTRLGFETERVVIPDELIADIPLPLQGPRVNLVARRSIGKEPVTIYAHMDVVPIEEGWQHDPFGAELDDGKIYGRGTADMKGSIASLLTAIEVMDEAGVEPNYDLIVCLCTDEEIGGYPGIWHLAKNGYVQGHMLCLEGGQDPQIGLASAGSVDVTITTIGKSCHSGSNYLGVNSIDAMLPIMNELATLKKDVENRESTVLGVPNEKAPSQYMTPMFNFAIIGAGVKSNIVPATCSLLINRRYIPEETYENVTEEILEAVERGKAKSNALDVKVDFFRVYPAMKMEEGPHMRKMMEALQLVQGYRSDQFTGAGSSGSTDMANVQQELGWGDIPFCGPGREGSRAHGADEFVYLDDVKAHMKELIHYLAF
ncbi:MAG TPA: M20/M25/M40 family metallo-hydrolase [Nitrolancea sp.]|nr:M20/M25/M40 family metallo-hydrolase [Nitrolancea sp.]